MIGASVVLLIIPYTSGIVPIVFLCLAASFLQLGFCCGFFLSHGDLSGQWNGFLYAYTSMLAQISAVLGQIAIAALTPNVRFKKAEKAFCSSYSFIIT